MPSCIGFDRPYQAPSATESFYLTAQATKRRSEDEAQGSEGSAGTEVPADLENDDDSDGGATLHDRQRSNQQASTSGF